MDSADNCSENANPAQDDTDGDDCGNLCDADYDQTGLVGFVDFSTFSGAYGSMDLEMDHSEPVVGPVGFVDFSFFAGSYGGVPGPSGTTIGTVACP